jgi:hypothetical protein
MNKIRKIPTSDLPMLDDKAYNRKAFRVRAFLYGNRRFAVIGYESVMRFGPIDYLLVPVDTLGIGNRVIEDGYQWDEAVALSNPDAARKVILHFSPW